MTPIAIDEVQTWAVAAGDVARNYFNHVKARRKADNSVVTEADEAIEQLLVNNITTRHPDHGILGEEHTRQDLSREFVWVIDPLDGTASFVSGLGSWCISIGLLRAGKPYLGVVYLPLLNDTYAAISGQGATLNGEPIHAIAPETWEEEDWMATPASLHRKFDLTFMGKTRVLGSLAAQMCYVARGSALAALLIDARPWDVAASLVITSEAGATVAPLDPNLNIETPLLEANWLREPLLVAHPSQINALRQVTHQRAISNKI